MKELKFSEATIDQFKEFWEGEGFKFYLHGILKCYAMKSTSNNIVLSVDWFRDVRADNDDGEEMTFKRCETFGEALDACNELANTKVFGGWA